MPPVTAKAIRLTELEVLRALGHREHAQEGRTFRQVSTDTHVCCSRQRAARRSNASYRSCKEISRLRLKRCESEIEEVMAIEPLHGCNITSLFTKCSTHIS